MLKRAGLNEILEHESDFYRLSQDLSRSSYPTFADGIKTAADFREYLEKGTERDEYSSLMYLRGGEVKGFVQFFVIPEEKYWQLTGCFIREGTSDALKELMEQVFSQYEGYELYFGFPEENQEACDLLREYGFSLIEDDYNNVAILKELAIEPEKADIRRIDCGNFGDFRQLHRVEETVYWNADRIFEDMGQWNIFVLYRAGRPVGAICETAGEIFAVDYEREYDSEALRLLTARVLLEAKERGRESMTFFCGAKERKIVTALGFRSVGRYMLYYKKN